MTNTERAVARALGCCRLPPASWVKRFLRDMAQRAEQPDAAPLSEKQRPWLWTLAYKFRRQLFQDGAKLTLEQIRRHYGDCTMTEQEWLSSTDPQRMLEYLTESRDYHNSVEEWARIATDRKLRLFACACCRNIWDQISDGSSRQAVEVAERYADGEATEAELGAARSAVLGVAESAAWGAAESAARSAARSVAESAARSAAWSAQAALLRDLFGNPFRPIPLLTLTVECDRCNGKGQRILGKECGACDGTGQTRGNADWLRWNDGIIPKIAQAIYQERRFADMPILGDALIEAGCDNGDILRHCRGQQRCGKCLGSMIGKHVLPDQLRRVGGGHRLEAGETILVPCADCNGTGWVAAGEHVRGCWILDLLLNKE